MQTNQLCLTLIDPHVHYNPIPVMKSQTSSRRIDDPGLIAACHCGAEYETEQSASIETHTPTSIDSTNQKSIDNQLEESIDSSPDDWENNYYNPTLAEHSARSSPRATPHREEYDADYEEERATKYKGICAEERNYSIGSWANDHYHQSYAVETAVHEPGADEPHEGFTNEELLNNQELSDKNLLFAEACGRGTRFCRPFTRANPPSNDTRVPPSIDIRSKPPSTVREKAKLDNNYLTRDEFGIFRDPESYARAIDGHALQVSREDITDILHATAQHSRAPAESCKQILQHSW